MRKESPSSKPGNRASESVERVGSERMGREKRSEKIIEDGRERKREEAALSEGQREISAW